MNNFIFDLLSLFVVDGVEIPVKWLKYKGDLTTYIVFSDLGETPASHADDDCEYSVIKFDFDIYTKGNFKNILKALKKKLTANGFTWVEDSPTMYEDDTGLYHITSTFEIEKYNQ